MKVNGQKLVPTLFQILCFFQKKEMHVGLKPHEGVSDDRIPIYGWTIPLKASK